jgi:pimeloyl-ACP methyl ester carboxylesterase
VAAELYGGRLRNEPALAGRLLHDQSRIGSRRGYLLQLLAGVGWSSLPGLPFIRQPVLVLAGLDDPIIPPVNARVIARLLPNATLHFYDDGHLGLVTAADELAPRIARFLRD